MGAAEHAGWFTVHVISFAYIKMISGQDGPVIKSLEYVKEGAGRFFGGVTRWLQNREE